MWLSRIRAGVVAVSIVFACPAARAEHPEGASEASADPGVVVRLYGAHETRSSDLHVASRTAAVIFQGLGVDVRWVPCPAHRAMDRSPGPCDTTPIGSDLVVQLVRGIRRAKTTVLGCAFVDRQTGTGVLASIFLDPVEDTAARLHIDAGHLLGRVMAHEIGHLVGMRHADVGLMRASWPAATLKLERGADFQIATTSEPWPARARLQ